MLNPLKEIKNRQNYLTEDDIPKIYHDFMLNYGYIPYEEFESMPISRILLLYKLINESKKEEVEYRKAVLKGLGYKI